MTWYLIIVLTSTLSGYPPLRQEIKQRNEAHCLIEKRQMEQIAWESTDSPYTQVVTCEQK